MSLLLSTSSSPPTPLVTFNHDPQSKIGTITIESPHRHNPLTVEMGKQFQKTISEIKSSISENNINVNCILLHGANSTFSAGGDIKWLKSLKSNPVHVNTDHMLDFYKSFLCVRDLPVPVISVIDGFAIGAGACLSLATDFRVMSAEAKIGFNFVKLGIHAGMGGSHFLPLIVGHSRAKDILLTGRVLTGVEAGELGVVQRVVRKTGPDLLEVARTIAIDIGSNSPLAVRAMSKTLRIQEDKGLEAALTREAFAQAACYAKSDWGEGIDAVIERRQPSFDDYSSLNDDWV